MQFTCNYNSKVVIYEHKLFIRLATEHLNLTFPDAGALVQDPGAEAFQGSSPDHPTVRHDPAVSAGRQVTAATQ